MSNHQQSFRHRALTSIIQASVADIPLLLVHSTLAVRRRIASLACVMVALSWLPASAQFPETSDESLALLVAMERATVAAIAKAEQSVVAVARVRRDREASATAGFLQLSEPDPGTELPQTLDFVPTFYGSGVVLSADGFIVTCAHVLDDPRRNDYYVWLDRRCYPAEVVGKPAQVIAADPYSDLAVLKIEAHDLTAADLADAGELRKGQFVIALGNPNAIARDGQASASWGIVSNLNRVAPVEATPKSVGTGKESIHQFGTLIQTDAKLSLGTSGGALVNLRGEVVGITTSLVATLGSETAAGFAIAVDPLFRRVLDSLKVGVLPEYGFLGIEPEELRPEERERGFSGARVRTVMVGLPAYDAGLRSDDIIYQVNGESIVDRNDLFRALGALQAGAEVSLMVLRDNSGRLGAHRASLPIKAILSKKRIDASRPSYSIIPPSSWRGMSVDYSTAVLDELIRNGRFPTRRETTKVTVMTVEPGTPTWLAGLRPGDGIVSVENQAVNTPEDFYNKVDGMDGAAIVQIIRSGDRRESLTVSRSVD
ncbi:MAG: trypsin-like peptidase domain-containing protein [Planctomycetales bacterium]|nr:trypsin-like peptidase domain-containing protein [Planctomycetales bacterium]